MSKLAIDGGTPVGLVTARYALDLGVGGDLVGEFVT